MKKTSVAICEDDLDRLYGLKENRKEPLYRVLRRIIDYYITSTEKSE